MQIELGILLFVLFMLMVLTNVPIAVFLGMATLLTIVLYDLPLDMYLAIVNAGLAKYTLLAVPFFILAGYIIEKAGISNRIVASARMCVGPIPGGLGIISIIVTLL